MADQLSANAVTTSSTIFHDTIINSSHVTGRSAMTDFAAKLVAAHAIRDRNNGPSYPITRHFIKPPALMRLFYNTTFQLCSAMGLELGVPDFNSTKHWIGL